MSPSLPSPQIDWPPARLSDSLSSRTYTQELVKECQRLELALCCRSMSLEQEDLYSRACSIQLAGLFYLNNLQSCLHVLNRQRAMASLGNNNDSSNNNNIYMNLVHEITACWIPLLQAAQEGRVGDTILHLQQLPQRLQLSTARAVSDYWSSLASEMIFAYRLRILQVYKGNNNNTDTAANVPASILQALQLDKNQARNLLKQYMASQSVQASNISLSIASFVEQRRLNESLASRLEASSQQDKKPAAKADVA